MMLLFVGSNRSYFEYHKNASAQTDVLIRLTRAAAFSCCGFLYNRMLKNRHFVVNQGSLPLV